jgi:hypothetical protein
MKLNRNIDLREKVAEEDQEIVAVETEGRKGNIAHNLK